MSNAKGRLQGCTAWAVAVTTAAAIPAGVRDLCDQALYTIASVTGTAIMAFISAYEEEEELRMLEERRRQQQKKCRLTRDSDTRLGEIMGRPGETYRHDYISGDCFPLACGRVSHVSLSLCFPTVDLIST